MGTLDNFGYRMGFLHPPEIDPTDVPSAMTHALK